MVRKPGNLPNMPKTPAQKTSVPKTPAIDHDVIRELANLLDETGLTEIEYHQDGVSIRVARNLVIEIVAGVKYVVPTRAAVKSPRVPFRAGAIVRKQQDYGVIKRAVCPQIFHHATDVVIHDFHGGCVIRSPISAYDPAAARGRQDRTEAE